MTKLDDGGPAFPHPAERIQVDERGVYHGHQISGMSLRAWFAGQALPHVITEIMRVSLGDHPKHGGGPAGFAATAYDIADAMLSAHKKGPSDE